MMSTGVKIIFTSLIMWLVTMFWAHPGTAFAKWGEGMCGTYANFLAMIAAFYLTPVAGIAIFKIWKQS